MLHNHNYLISNKSAVALVEYTTRCNLRCTYCAVSSDSWIGKDIESNISIDITKQIIKRNPNIVAIHGHGETTIYKDWQIVAREYLDNGINLSICSNLSKQYTDDEINLLAQFEHISVSIDTTNPVVFSELRKGSKLDRVLNNIKLIKKKAANNNNNLYMTWSMVCCDKTIFDLCNSVKQGIELGIQGFTISNLTIDDSISNVGVKHVSDFHIDDCIKSLNELKKLQQLCMNHNVSCDIKAGLFDTLNARINVKKI